MLHDVGRVGDLARGRNHGHGAEGTHDQVVVVEDVRLLRCRAEGNARGDGASAVDEQTAAANLNAVGGCRRAGGEGDVTGFQTQGIGVEGQTAAADHGGRRIDEGALRRNARSAKSTAADAIEAGVHEAVLRRVGEKLELRGVDDPRGDHAVSHTAEGDEAVGTRATEELDALIAAELAAADGGELE